MHRHHDAQRLELNISEPCPGRNDAATTRSTGPCILFASASGSVSAHAESAPGYPGAPLCS